MLKLACCLILSAAGLLTGGCQCFQSSQNTADAQNKKEVDGIQKKLNDALNPRAAIPSVREYALEKMEDLTDAEEKTITTTEPKISANYEQTEYSYVWKVDDHKKKFIEVLTTPAPFMPIGAFRVNRTYYP